MKIRKLFRLQLFFRPEYQRDYRTIHVWGELCSDLTWMLLYDMVVCVWTLSFGLTHCCLSGYTLCPDFIPWLDMLLFWRGVCSVSRPSILIYCCQLQWTLHPDHVSWLDILQCIIHAYLPSKGTADKLSMWFINLKNYHKQQNSFFQFH
jgi:hypothetical protein